MRKHLKQAIFATMSAAAVMTLATSSSSIAGDLIYQPTNPAFGGSPLLDDYLVNTAQIQNRFTATGGGGGGGGSPPPVINFPPITIDLGGAGGTGEAAAARQVAPGNPSAINQINQ